LAPSAKTLPSAKILLDDATPEQEIQPETVATVDIVKVNGAYPLAQVYPVIKFLLTST